MNVRRDRAGRGSERHQSLRPCCFDACREQRGVGGVRGRAERGVHGQHETLRGRVSRKPRGEHPQSRWRCSLVGQVVALGVGEMGLEAQREFAVEVERDGKAVGEHGCRLALALHAGELDAEDQCEPRLFGGRGMRADRQAQVVDSGGASSVELGHPELRQDRGALLEGRRFFQRASEQTGRDVGRAALECLCGRSAQCLHRPRFAGGLARDQLCRDPLRVRAVVSQQAGRSSVCRASKRLGQVIEDGFANERVSEHGSRSVGEDVGAGELGGDACRGDQFYPCQCCHLSERCAVAEHGHRDSQGARRRLELVKPRSDQARHTLGRDCRDALDGRDPARQRRDQLADKERIAARAGVRQRRGTGLGRRLQPPIQKSIHRGGGEGPRAKQPHARRRPDRVERDGCRRRRGTRREQERHGEIVEATRERGEESHRRLVGPVSIVDGH